MSVFDIAILGAGPGGYSTALRGAALGLKVALIEKNEIGGVCLNRGCVPAKVWILAAETLDHAKHMASFSKKPFDYSLDFKKVALKQRAIVSQFQNNLKNLLDKKGITIIEGMGKFKAPNTITVEKGDSLKEINFKHGVIATGSRPSRLFDLDPPLLLDSSSVFNLDDAPGSIIIVGAGAIGSEFASVFTRFGTEVTLIELEPQILPTEDGQIASTLERELKKAKVKIITGAQIESLEPNGKGVIARLKDGREFLADMALSCVGRNYVTDNLGLRLAGVNVGDRKEVVTDKKMRTSAPNIFAVGDVAGKNMLAYTAYKEGELVAEIISGKDIEPKEMVIPNAIFTIPEIGSVGLTQENAPASARIGSFMFRALARAHGSGEIAGFVKVIADADTDRLLGVHIIGPRATDLIHTASVAISQKMTAAGLGDLLFAHPTFSEAISEAAQDVHKKSLHK